jgi:hypothetical protein
MRCRFDSAGFCHNALANQRDGVNTPSESRCGSCPNYEGPLRGLGDVVATVARVTGIDAAVKAVAPDCGCAKRQQMLNEKIPFT